MNGMRISSLLLVVLALFVVACDADQEVITTEATAIELPGFQGLPLPEAAVELTPAATVDGVSSQAFEVTGSTPADVLGFYESALADDWTVVVPPAPIGLGEEVQPGSEARVYRGGWTNGETDVLVTSSPAGDQVQVSRMNLLLGPVGSGVFDFDGEGVEGP
jgi:hypothetical protein